MKNKGHPEGGCLCAAPASQSEPAILKGCQRFLCFDDICRIAACLEALLVRPLRQMWHLSGRFAQRRTHWHVSTARSFSVGAEVSQRLLHAHFQGVHACRPWMYLDFTAAGCSLIAALLQAQFCSCSLQTTLSSQHGPLSWAMGLEALSKEHFIAEHICQTRRQLPAYCCSLSITS